MVKEIYHDNFGNTATIEEVYIYPYRGASDKEKGYRLTITADYDNDFVYHVEVVETLTDARHNMNELSCGFWTKGKTVIKI